MGIKGRLSIQMEIHLQYDLANHRRFKDRYRDIDLTSIITLVETLYSVFISNRVTYSSYLIETQKYSHDFWHQNPIWIII